MTDSKSLNGPPSLEDAISAVSEYYGADVLVYVGMLSEPDDDSVLRMCRNMSARRKNLVVVVSTPGGSADAAYRIARAIHRAYDVKNEDPTKRGVFYLYVHDFCKSAGTMLSLGASALIMSQRAQLGPIDVQLLKEDEVGERRSGLAPRQALETLSTETGRAFNRLFRYMRFDSRIQLATKMSAELAAQMAIGVMQPVYAQLDPMRLGEIERYVRIAQEYGDRLRTSNVKRGTTEKLLGGYPSHEFVIDREEARELFDRVEVPTDELEMVAEAFITAHHPSADNMDSFIAFVSQPVTVRREAKTNTDTEQSDDHVNKVDQGATGEGKGSDGREVRPNTSRDPKRPGEKPNGSGSVEGGRS